MTQLPTHWEFLVFPLVGALIGALTNDVAIRMLFRPYRAVMLGGLRLPFTPGLIPSQRHIIANNIAETFERQLLSSREVHAFLTGPQVRASVDAKFDEILAGLGPMGVMAAGLKPKIVEKMVKGLDEIATNAVDHGGELNIGQRIEGRINEMEIAQLEELILGFSRKQFRHITFFGGVLGFLIGCAQAGLSTWLG